jgi:CO dehydrogenase/acetyl-CoA synthase beta subunit
MYVYIYVNKLVSFIKGDGGFGRGVWSPKMYLGGEIKKLEVLVEIRLKRAMGPGALYMLEI